MSDTAPTIIPAVGFGVAGSGPTAEPSRNRSRGWLPNQHGAWPMLVIPCLGAIVLRVDENEFASYLLPLLPCWLLGYFTFFAASAWLKSPPGRRAAYRPALLTCAAGSTVAGLLTLTLAGPGILGWAPPFVALLATALWLAARRRERALLGGAVTVAAACLITLVARFDSPIALVEAWPGLSAQAAIGLAVVLFGYFFGTVLYVKTMIRQRGRPAWVAVSIGWHAVSAAVMLISGQPVWGAFFLLATVRAALLPLLARRRPISPKVVGWLEAGLSLLAVGCIFVA